MLFVVEPASNPWLSQNSLESAAVIVPLVLRYVPAQSVVDLGCKHGEWLSVFNRHGVSSILGFDQEKRAPRLTIEPSQFRTIDLNKPHEISGTFDLAVCIEVAEHLQETSARPLVQTLTRLAPVVLFSAAIPGQGGHGHLNEQPRGYWHALFAEAGFSPIDCLRTHIWQDPRVAFWYRQNLFFYASQAGRSRYPLLAAEVEKGLISDLELVHVDVLYRRSLLRRVIDRITNRRHAPA